MVGSQEAGGRDYPWKSGAKDLPATFSLRRTIIDRKESLKEWIWIPSVVATWWKPRRFNHLTIAKRVRKHIEIEKGFGSDEDW